MKILVLGAGGMIGHRIWLEAQNTAGVEVFGVLRKPKSAYQKFNIFNENIFDNMEASNWQSIESLLEKIRPNIIVNAIGITIRKEELNNFEVALAINSYFPRRLLKWSQSNNARVIHMSTDCVFDGKGAPYSETSQPSAKDTYGTTKFLGEIEGERALTLRFSCIGRELYSHTELLDWILTQKSEHVSGFGKAIYTGLTTHVIAREVLRAIVKFPDLNGIYQLSSSPISKYDLLCLIKEKFGLAVEIARNDNHVTDKSLLCDKYARVTGFKAPNWNEMVDELLRDSQVNYNV